MQEVTKDMTYSTNEKKNKVLQMESPKLKKYI